jgi:hypothetical protein
MRVTTPSLIEIIGCLAFLISHCVSGQELNIDYIEFAGRNVIVHYDLDDGTNSNRQFLVQLYSSQDNYTTPLTRISGDVGTEVSAGFDKKIVWDITKELGSTYKGEIALELRGRVYVPFVKLQGLDAGKVFKRGKNYPLNWTSGNLTGHVNIELFNEKNERLWGENNVSNVGKFDWFIPTGVRKGNNYVLKFTNTKDRNDVVYSKPFVIKPKISMVVKLAAIGVVAVATQLAFSLLKEPPEPEAEPLVDPPSAPKN